MSLTFVQLQDKVHTWLNGDTAATADSNKVALVREALAEADVERTMQKRWPFMASTEQTFLLVPGQQAYTLPSDFHIPIFFVNDSAKKDLIQFDLEDIPSRDYAGGFIDNYFTTSPQYGGFWLEGQTLQTTWIPASADTIRFKYYKIPTEPSADGDLPNTPYPHSRVLIYDALLRLAADDESVSPTKLQLWAKKQEEHETALLEAHGQTNNQFTHKERVNYSARD